MTQNYSWLPWFSMRTTFSWHDFLLCWPSSMKDVTSAANGNCANIINFAKNHPNINALSFYVTKTGLVGPKWFWSDQIDLDLTIMIWSRPKWNGHDQNELVRSKLWFSTKMNHIWTWPIHFGRDHFILVMTISFWSWPNHYDPKSKSIWSEQNHFGPTKTVLVT